MRKFILLLLIGSVSFTYVNAQDKLIMASGDTLQGKIEILFPDDYYEEIIFENDDDKRRMKAYEFVGFIHKETIYKTIKNGDKYQIMRLRKAGYLSLFEYRIDKAYNYSGMYAFLRSGAGTDIPNVNFKKVMAKFLSDCNAVSAAVKNGSYKRKNIEELVDDYNACISQNTIESRAGTPTTPVSTEAAELASEANDILKEAQSLEQTTLATMLEDAIDKINNGEEVPLYLKKAIEEQVGEDNPLYAKITSLLQKL